MDKMMNTIVCPECGTVIPLDEEKYSRIVAQVRSEQFEKEVLAQVNAVKDQQEAKHKALLMEEMNKYQKELSQKEQEITRLLDQAKSQEMAQKQELDLLQANAEVKRKDDLAEKDRQIQELNAKIKEADTLKELAVTRAISEKNTEITELKARITQVENEAEIREMSLKDVHKTEMKLLQDELAEARDQKLRLSTKLLGEDLEQHIKITFERNSDSFPNAYFEKDNDVVEGTKGDFIYREKTDDGIEIVSIMFEVKNEADDSVKKHKNESFLEKLDKDRQKKNCEYAVLVSMLEPENELYNDGIVAARKYEKMFIIRPQFFIPLIKVLRKAALANIEARRELMLVQRENLDVQKFDAALVEFRDKFGRNCELAQGHFDKTIKEITEAIKHLTKVKEELEATGKQLNLANNKAQELTIKKLTKGNIGMQQKFLDAGIEIT